jgi:choline dehydrogenase-like flavoprotein
MNRKSYIGLLIMICLLMPISIFAKEQVDYIVVGAGTAGATIAKMLSDNPNTSVLVLHNGKNLSQNPDIKLTKNAIFTVISTLFGPPLSITGETTPQPNIDDRMLNWVMGLPEGGATAINAGAWARGTDQIYSQWEAFGGPEWSTAIIENLYKSLENYVGTTSNSSTRGVGGPLNIRQVPTPTPFSFKFTQAIAVATGVPIVIDYNDPFTPIGASTQLQYTQIGANGQFRLSSANAFLNRKIVTPSGKGAKGRKLNVKLKSRALRTIWKGNKAIGVEYFHQGKIEKAYAKKGVIVCAGLFSSAFLMHSGVGPKKALESLGIKVKYDNPNVGQALADQNLLIIAWTTNPADTPICSNNTCSIPKNLPGGLSLNELNPALFSSLSTADQMQLINAILCNGCAFPENSIFAQIAWLPAPGGPPDVRQVRFNSVNPFPGIAFTLVDLVQPLSRGSISLKSFNPFVAPVISEGTFSNASDLNLYVQTFQTYIKQLNATLHQMDDKYELLFPPEEIIDDVELLTAFIKNAVMSNQCWQSHCRMAPLNQGGVVNGRGQVYGVENLFLADDSIVPVPMDGTPMASAYLIAANIARLLMQ